MSNRSTARPPVAPAGVATAILVVIVGALSIASCSDSEPSASAPFCDLYVEYRTSVEASKRGTEPDAEAVDLPDIVGEASSVVPEDVSDAWAVIVDSQNDFEEARTAAGFDPGDPDEEMFEDLDLERTLRSAEDDVRAWVDENCEPLSEY